MSDSLEHKTARTEDCGASEGHAVCCEHERYLANVGAYAERATREIVALRLKLDAAGEVASIGRSLAIELIDSYLDTIEEEWGVTNVEILRRKRDRILELVSTADSGDCTCTTDRSA